MPARKPQGSDIRIAVKFLKACFGRQERAIEALNKLPGFALPLNSTYPDILLKLKDKDAGLAFSKAYAEYLKCASFEECCRKYAWLQGLRFLDANQLGKLTAWLGEHGHKALLTELATLKRPTFGEKIVTIVANVDEADLRAGLNALVASTILAPVSQSKEWVRGPLGITLALRARAYTDVDDILKLLERIPRDIIPQFADTIGLVRQRHTWGKRIDPLYSLRFMQSALSDALDEQILKAFNQLLDARAFSVGKIERLSNIILTPCGAFEKEYGGEQSLARVLQLTMTRDELELELANKGLQVGPLKLRLMQLCYKETPDQILKNYVGSLSNLRKAARILGLVRVNDELESPYLIEILLLRMGFSPRQELVGLEAYITNLQASIQRVKKLSLPNHELQGIMTDAFAGAESVLKDILRFYVCFFLKSTSALPEEPDEQLKAIDKLFQTTLGQSHPIARMNLEPLKAALIKLDGVSAKHNIFRHEIKAFFGRDRVLVPGALDALQSVQSTRTAVTHHVEDHAGVGRIPGPEECLGALNGLLDFARVLKDQGVYPSLIRLLRQVRDDYGRDYLEAVDENQNPLVIANAGYVDMEAAYFIRATTSPIAVRPLLIRKLA